MSGRFLVPSGMAPPDDKPWLISTVNDLEEDDYEKLMVMKDWLKDHPFPGRRASSDAKLAWLAALHKEYVEEQEDSFYQSTIPQAYEIVSETLLKEAPAKIVLQIRVNRKDLTLLEGVQQDRFAKGVTRYGRDDYKGEPNWEAYKAWLLKSDDRDLIVIGSVECSKNDKSLDVSTSFAKSLGLDEFLVGLSEVDLAASTKACYTWGLMTLVGENIYYPLPDKRICFSVVLKFKVPAIGSNDDKASREFMKRLEAIKEATLATDTPKTYLLVPKVTDGANRDSAGIESLPETAENYHVLWLPSEYQEEDDRMRPHFNWGEGESRSLQQRMQKGNTDSGNVKAALFQSELRYVKSRYGLKRSWQSKFCSALALTRIGIHDRYWLYDNEFQEEIVDMIKDLATYWRITLLRKDDKTLGLGLADEQNTGEGEVSESRKALIRILEILGKQYETSSPYCKVKFNIIAGHSRNPKAPNAQNKKRKTEER